MNGNPGLWWLAALFCALVAGLAWTVVVEKHTTWLIVAAVYTTLLSLLCGMQASKGAGR